MLSPRLEAFDNGDLEAIAAEYGSGVAWDKEIFAVLIHGLSDELADEATEAVQLVAGEGVWVIPDTPNGLTVAALMMKPSHPDIVERLDALKAKVGAPPAATEE